MSKRPFWLFAGRFQSIFSHFGDVFGLFPTLLFLILRRMIFRLAVIDLHICAKYPFVWRFFGYLFIKIFLDGC